MALLASGLSTASPATPTIISLYVIPLMIDRHRPFGKALGESKDLVTANGFWLHVGVVVLRGGYPRGHRRHHPRRTGGQRPGIPDVGKGPLRRLGQRHFAAFSCRAATGTIKRSWANEWSQVSADSRRGLVSTG